jgi:predicted ester cyclase
MIGIMSTEQNKTIARRYAEELQDFWRSGDLSFVDRIFDSNYVQHIPGVPPNMSVKQIFAALRAAIPDFQTTIEDLIAEGDKVAVRISWQGTHKGELMGIPPTGKHVKVTEMQIYRMANGKIVERWVETDVFGMMQQLGIIPTPEQQQR